MVDGLVSFLFSSEVNMKRFFVNKYPVNYGCDSDGKQSYFPVGTIFTIVGISCNMFELQPIKKTVGLEYPLQVDAAMLGRGFMEQDHLES